VEWHEKCGRDGCASEKLEFVPFIMLRCSLIVLGLIAAATAVPINPEPISDAPLFNTSSGYNPGAAVAFAKANCGSSQGLCAEFASRSMAAGGAGNPVITWVPDLVSVTAMLRCSHRVTLCAINSRLPAVDGRSRLENDRNAVLRPRRLCRHLRRDVRGQRPRRLLSGRRPHLPAQPRPLQARFMPAPILRVFMLLFVYHEFSRVRTVQHLGRLGKAPRLLLRMLNLPPPNLLGCHAAHAPVILSKSRRP
jgi:hypothetical protein